MKTVEELSKEQSLDELRLICNEKDSEISLLKREIADLNDKLIELSKPFLVPVEQDICETQIKKLQEDSLKRPLTLEEVKRLDLLIKNLYLSKGKSSSTMSIELKNMGVSEEDLIAIAATRHEQAPE